MKMEQTECSETLALKLQTPVKNQEESINYRFIDAVKAVVIPDSKRRTQDLYRRRGEKL
jgi:hypothetical protein